MNSNDVSIDFSSGERPTHMTTLSSIMERLRIKGYDHEFKWTDQGLSIGTGKFYQPDELLIVKVYRFEGESDPADSSILYIIKANDELIGYSLDMYGMYSNHEEEEGYDNFIRQIPLADHEEQLVFTI
jgi:hypothetical protein